MTCGAICTHIQAPNQSLCIPAELQRARILSSEAGGVSGWWDISCSLQVPLSFGVPHLQNSNDQTLATLTSSFDENLEVGPLYTETPGQQHGFVGCQPISKKLISRNTPTLPVLTMDFSSSLLIEDKNSVLYTHTNTQQEWVRDGGNKLYQAFTGFRTLRNTIHSLTIMVKFIRLLVTRGCLY